jgi:hypothetical protein
MYSQGAGFDPVPERNPAPVKFLAAPSFAIGMTTFAPEMSRPIALATFEDNYPNRARPRLNKQREVSMATRSRRAFLQSAALTAAGTLSASVPGPPGLSLAQTTLGNSRLGVKTLFFDVFGTLVDWRTGVAREAEAHLKPRGYSLDWLAFADAWRAEYQPAMEEVRSDRIPFL